MVAICSGHIQIQIQIFGLKFITKQNVKLIVRIIFVGIA